MGAHLCGEKFQRDPASVEGGLGVTNRKSMNKKLNLKKVSKMKS
jgi:hypothetical protein